MSSIWVRWLGEYRTEVDVRGVHRVRADETPEYGGQDTGPMPTELLVAAVASCMCMAVVHVARKRRVTLGELRLEAERDVDVQNFRFNSIRLTVHADVPQEELTPLVEQARRYCYVSNTVRNGCPVEVVAQSSRTE